MKAFCGVLIFLIVLSGSVSADDDFCPRQFRANAASIVKDMHEYLTLFRTLAMFKLEEYSLGKHAIPVMNTFFDTLPQYTRDCHAVSKGAKSGYTVQLFLTDLSSNFETVVTFYRELRAQKDASGKEDRCLSEHVIHFLADNKDIADALLSVLKMVNRARRDEL
ncbi:uncharacterized protein LOC100901156 [Galendromus occidentalis]|uniref:Uncharacterized protein LOC100901156 n=1 Tax=Galendromus occidentalis TaxID=34638 RepID=A0AAJ6QR70_9ACAR|nr:uncharacterized protein LOC100901156 [Galendromus occidentalis]